MFLKEVSQSQQIPPQRIHVGDRVVVTNPEFVTRVGYPMSYDEAYHYVAKNYLMNIEEMLGSTIFQMGEASYRRSPFALSLHEDPTDITKHSKDMKQLIGAVAKMYMKFKDFGGKTRSIHTQRLDSELGRICEVTSKRVCKTGIYYPGGSSTSYEGEVDYWPGGLEECKTHVLLELDVFFSMAFESKDWNRYPGTWIESCNVRRYDGQDLGETRSAYAKRVQTIV